ncbi:hypothetical protein CDD83_2446 [Cordyceps sp. RAO-2017]|nr:hypothetical protein CDD83_2446 [Cordyceps sp. RAO-2017]
MMADEWTQRLALRQKLQDQAERLKKPDRTESPAEESLTRGERLGQPAQMESLVEENPKQLGQTESLKLQGQTESQAEQSLKQSATPPQNK